MKMAHLLLEIYCEYEEGRCIYGKDKMGVYCFENKCNLLSYTYCPNELAYSGNEGVVLERDSFIGFGGEMDADSNLDNYDKEHRKCLNEWEKVCKEKISDAYESYMNCKK